MGMFQRLEADLSERACDPDTDPATIEHVLPENPGAEWEEMFDSQHWERSIYRLGNLTLLEPALNRRVGNRTYREKQPIYEVETRYALTRQLAELAATEWTPALLDSRQQAMARRAVHVWRFDFE